MDSNITVLKFGSSILRSDADLSGVVHEIYRHWRNGSKVLAVVSAFGSTTDELQVRAETLAGEPHSLSLALLLATGEATSAALLGIALDRAGLPVKVLNPHQARVRTSGHTLDAAPVGVDDQKLRTHLQNSIVVVSGFVGVDDRDELTLLGRGGSDLTALFLADSLNARCVLLKDVDGLYDADPNSAIHRPRRFVRSNWSTCLDLGGDVVQPKAVRFAKARGLEFSIAAPGSLSETVVGEGSDALASAQRSAPPLRISLLGCGTVGGGVYKALAALPHFFEVVGVAERNRDKAIAAGVPDGLISDDSFEIIERDSDVVVELFGGTSPTDRFVRHAIELGRRVVTANKALLAEHLDAFADAADQNGTGIRFSAAVGGVMPALESVSRTANVTSISGIVNGTCNFICDVLASGVAFSDAVRSAQAAGFAEADPTIDISGKDAAQKLVLLARAAFGITLSVDDIDVAGITDLDPKVVREAALRGNAIRLVVDCRRTVKGIEARVGPREFASDHPFAATRGADNCLLIESSSGETLTVRGRGAGRWPTTEAVIADLLDLHRELASPVRPLALAAAHNSATEARI